MRLPKITDTKKLKTTLFKGDDTRAFWKKYEINIDRYCDKWEYYQTDLIDKCKIFNSTDLTIILSAYKTGGTGSLLERLLSDTKSAIDFYCVLKFAERMPKVLSRFLNIPIRSNNIDRRQVAMRVFERRNEDRLTELFFIVLSQSKGSGNYRYKVFDPNNSFTFESVDKHTKNLIKFLNRKSDQEYQFRFIDKVKDDYYVLLVKETSDKMICALPANVRVQSGQYILIRWHKKDSLFSIDTKDYHESNRIKNYMAKKTKLAFKYTREQGTYNAEQFLDSLLTPRNLEKDLLLLELKVRSTTTGDHTLTISNNKKKNNIVDSIKQQIDTRAIKLENFSNYKSITFLYREISFVVQFRLDKYNHIKLHLIDQKKPEAEVKAFKAAFNKTYAIPFDAFLRNEDETADLIQVTRKMIADKTISAEMPQEYEDLVVRLVNDKFLQQPTENGRRRCVKCNSVFWKPGDCRTCGTETYFEGDYLDINVNTEAFEKFIFKSASSIEGVKVNNAKRQIQKSKFSFIELMTKEGLSLSIFICNGMVPDKIMNYFTENGLPLLIILIKYKDGLDIQIRSRNIECADFSEIVNQDSKSCKDIIAKALTDQHTKWQQKITEKGAMSYARLLHKPKVYNDQFFERDIFNLLHEIFLVADRMGEKLTGTKAPDGIACIQNHAKLLKRFCMAWDCKYSVAAKGYSLQEKPAKHRYYLKMLAKNDKVEFFGGLSVYAFISQNMNMTKYVNFYKKMTADYRVTCQILILFEEQILMLYKIYKDNEQAIQLHPELFYARIIALLTKLPKSEAEPYKWISKERILKTFDSLKEDFGKVHRDFKFTRSDFIIPSKK